MGDLYRRLGEAVERVSDRLQEDENGKPLVFRNSMIENIRDLVDVVPRLNIFADDQLARLCEQVKEKIAGVEPDALRPSKTFDPTARAQVKRDADDARGEVRGLLRAAARARAEGSVMSARVLHESALRVSDCVAELLRKQPFFGSLVLRLPLRPDATRETLATDGQEIRYSPRWVAETDSHLIETAMARVVMACALEAPHATGRAGPGALAGGIAARHPRAHSRRRASRCRRTPRRGTASPSSKPTTASRPRTGSPPTTPKRSSGAGATGGGCGRGRTIPAR